MKKDDFRELITLWTHSSDAFLILDDNATILYANPALEQVSGLEIKKQVGHNIRELLRTGMIDNSASLKAAQQKRVVTSKLLTAAGKRLLSTASPVLDRSGNIYRIVCNVRSLSLVQPEEKAGESPLRTPRDTESLTGTSSYEIVYASSKMQKVVELAHRLAAVDSTVLITGETGVGKELVARLIHGRSPRAGRGNFVKINCAAIPRDLLESELFGYAPGAFTGALKFGKEGYLERAHGGTLFLDEIAELPLEAQAKLLGVLQDREYYKVGSTKASFADVRIIAATNRDLAALVAKDAFRKDLYYRLLVVPVEVPPLRERRQDIPVLISHFCARLAARCGFKKEFDAAAVKQLCFYGWPGNVRELESLVERLLITVPEERITLSCLPGPYAPLKGTGNLPLKAKVEQYELELIKAELERCRDKYEAAKNLGISVSSLFRKLKLFES